MTTTTGCRHIFSIRVLMHRWREVLFFLGVCALLCAVCNAENLTAPEWIVKGSGLAKNGQYEEAIAAYDKAIEENQSFADPWISKGNAFQNLKRFPEAVASYDKAIEIDPGTLSAWNGKGNSLKSLNRYDEALDAFNKVIEINVNNTAGYQSKAGILQSLKRYEEAVSVYDQALKLDPKSISTYMSKAGALKNLQKYDDAITVYDQVLVQNSSYIPAYTGKADTLSTQKRYSESLNIYDLAIKKDPGAIWAWNGRGNVLLNLKRYEEAVSTFDHVIGLNETYAPAWRNKANSLLKLKRTTEAMAAYDQALANDPKYFGVWMEKGNLLINLNNYPEAEEAFDQAIAVNQSDASAWNAKGKSLVGAEKYADAVKAFNEALRLNPNLTDVQKNRENAKFKLFLESNNTSESNPVPETPNIQADHNLPSNSDSGIATPRPENWWSDILNFLFGEKPKYPISQNYDGKEVAHQVQLLSPVDICQQNNTLLIVDEKNRSIIRFDSSGTITLLIGGIIQPELFKEVTSVTSDNQDNIYVLDAESDLIYKFDDSGEMISSWGSNGSDPGQFYNPRHIEYISFTDPVKEIISVADTGNNRIQFFDLNGKFINIISTLHGLNESVQITPDRGQQNILSETRQYLNITPEEKANPPIVERTFNVQIRDITYAFSLMIDRGMYLGAQKNDVIDVNVNDKNPELWEPILKGELSDPITVNTISNAASKLQACSYDNKLTDSESMDLLCTFIQQIPLVNESDKRYPIEVLHDKKASSSDKALFLYGLLYQAGYDVVFLSYPGTSHCAVAIRTDKSVDKPAMKEYNIENKSYIYLNPDKPDIIGRIDPSISGVDPFILHVLPQDVDHSHTLLDKEKRLMILETLDMVGKKQAFIEANLGKFSSTVRKQVSADLDKIKAVKTYVESNTWNTEGIDMRLKNSKVGEIQLNYGVK